MPDTVEFVDRGNVEKSMDVLVVPGESAFEYLTTVKYGNFDQYSVKIRIEDGAVVEFSRDYRP